VLALGRFTAHQAETLAQARMAGSIIDMDATVMEHQTTGTFSGRATLSNVIADECRVHGFCDLSNDAIAARAGGHRTTVQSALRKARELGLITVQNRGRHGQRNLTNVVQLIASEWLAWLQLGAAAGSDVTEGRPPAIAEETV
jgi:hypothetical protein